MTLDPAAPLTKGQRTRLAILEAARTEFAAAGYERATIRGIARAACVDPGLVMQYFGNKDNLFTQAAQFEMTVSGVFDGPPEQLAERLLRQFFTRWEEGCGSDPMIAMLRSSLTNEGAAAELRNVINLKAGGPIAAHLGGGPEAEVRAGLIVSFMFGIGLTRYLLGGTATADADVEMLVAQAAPALQALIDGPTPAPPAPAEPVGTISR